MTPLAAAALGMVAGLIIGSFVFWLIFRGSGESARRSALVSDHVEEVISNLRAAAVVVNGDDSVVVASAFARGCGLVRGSTIAPKLVLDQLGQARAQGRAAEFELRLSRGPAVPPVLLGIRVIPLSDGTAVVVGEDRSADLRFSETRRDFVANITHELKTPIGAILLLAEAADAAAEDPAAARAFVGKLNQEALRLNELVSQILALSRLQAVDPLLEARPVMVADILERAVARCRELAQARSIQLSLTAVEDLRVTGDAEQLEAAMTNLVQNAIAYSEPGAKVAVSSRASDGFVELRVSDNGIGISEADQARIFERFYRVDADRSRASGGTGLGLSIVKHVASAHGGDVGVWSKPGQGSTFTVRLPASLEGAPA